VNEVQRKQESLCSACHVKTICIASSLMVGRNVTAWGVCIRESLRAFASLQLQVGVDLLTAGSHQDILTFAALIWSQCRAIMADRHMCTEDHLVMTSLII